MPKKASIVIGVLAALYLAVRLWRLTDPCLWFDEIFGVHAAEHTWGGMFWFVARDLIHPPLFYSLLKLWVSIGGEGLLWLRLFPVFLAVLALVPFLYLCKELKLSSRATALALTLFAFNGALIKYAQEVRMYSLLLCLSLFSIWLFARFFYRGKNIWILTLVNILLVHTHYFGWLVVLSEIAVIAILQRIKVRHVLVMAGIAAVSSVPWFITVLRAAGEGSEVSQNIGWIKPPGARSLYELFGAIVEPFHFAVNNLDPATIIWVSLPLMLVFGGAALLWFRDRGSVEEKDRVWLLGMLVLVPIVFAFLLSWLLPYSVWGARHLIVVFAPASILFALLVTEAARTGLRRTLLAVTGLMILIAGVRYIGTRVQEQVWCAWAPLTREWLSATHFANEPKRLYAFEDLAAYHIWFESRAFSNNRVMLVTGVEGVPNDPAYFLPRGFDAVGKVDLTEISEPEIWIAFRQRTKERPPWTAIIGPRQFEAPVTHLENMGYVVQDVRQREMGIQTVYLVKMAKAEE